jgi:hypothetical protein
MTASTRWAGPCIGCGNPETELESREEHNEKALCDACAAKPYQPPVVYSSDLQERSPRRASDAIGRNAAATLTKLLALNTVDLSVKSARIVGRGSRASVDLELSDGSWVYFERFADIGNPGRLVTEIVACTGAQPTLKSPEARQVMALIRTIAEHEETVTSDDIAREWGRSFLQAADELHVDMTDQAQRWGAFEHLDRIDPVAAYRQQGIPVAKACKVLVDLDGSRYARAGWLRAHVRHEDPSVSQAEIAHRMSRVGWLRRGREGLVKATAPTSSDTLSWAFYIVPRGWEDPS